MNVPAARFGRIGRRTFRPRSRLDAILHACHPRLVNGYDWTRSIIDLAWVTDERDYGAVTALGDAALRDLFGTTRPTQRSGPLISLAARPGAHPCC
jgi:hypothetical protein